MHSSRGRYSNNRGGRGRWYGSTVQRGGMELPEKALPFGTVISTLTHEEVKTSLSSGRATSITGCHEADEQRLTSEVDTTQTASSTGRRFRRLLPRYQRRTIPKHPIEPAVRAVLSQNPDFIPDEIDLFACGSTMGHLLRFARKSDKKFRFVVEVVDGTVFFIRRENSPDEKIPDLRGYGHTMPEAYTTLDSCIRGSVSHQRMIRYEIGGIECVVRCESDGYLADKGTASTTANVCAGKFETLQMLAGGKVVPQAAIFDIKTRSVRKKGENILAAEITRLWLRQIPNFIMAYHRSGVFEDIEVLDIRKQILQWETEHADEISVFSAILERVITFARSQAGIAFEVCSQLPHVLEFRQVGGQIGSVLPDELKKVWTDCNLDADEESTDGASDEHIGSDAGGGVSIDSGGEDDSDGEPDYTACTERCDYCGRCKY
ncbi:uncharacterized protein MYCGRDRAFT_92938 [Zymoseptoria tritici IPO323]|uniref:Geranylgeranyl pyrophosphate synthetase n=1 Tax=Zymoseptoria tritici (strain CBS 115943 / IPO323) TaxID=336722 RepID=F9XAI1_ZYMTI|nr:uncharacterized protein MYCGRDRAFT_92938 [Zymoseptoria tritici IPO323]EGP86996.1 hypothetical protein MYCGRDRAFT_92938 [Zymoseptoria tritici IPO323]